MSRGVRVVFAAAVLAIFTAASGGTAAGSGSTELISRASASAGGLGGDAYSILPDISANGRWVAFTSEARNLGGPIDPGSDENVYVYDRELQTVELISRASHDGPGANGLFSTDVSISADGRWVAFATQATNLGGPIDPGADFNVYLYDRKKDRVELVSRQSASAGGLGADARSRMPSVSADGRLIAFESAAGNLGGPAKGVRNVYVYDRKTKEVELISRRSKSNGGAGGNDDSAYPEISSDGSVVGFQTQATNLGGPISTGPPGSSVGRGGASEPDWNVYAREIGAKKTSLVSRASKSKGGAGGNESSYDPSLSEDGRRIGFATASSNLGGRPRPGISNVYVYDRKDKSVKLVSRASAKFGGDPGNGDSFAPSLSASGKVVAFATSASNLGGPVDATHNNVYFYDRSDFKYKATLASRGPSGGADGNSIDPAIAANGRTVAFGTEADNLGGPLDPSVTNVYLRSFGG